MQGLPGTEKTWYNDIVSRVFGYSLQACFTSSIVTYTSVLCSTVKPKIISFHTEHSLVWDNKPRREATVAMRVTGTGESSPVVPRRQDGSVGLRTLCRSPSHCLYYLSGVCAHARERETKQHSFGLLFSCQTSLFLETDKRKRGEMSKKKKKQCFLLLQLLLFLKSLLVIF